ncbi:hypothetical protein JCM10450v2_003655 [Rhodotorula kratochvilovae]
MGIGGLLPLLKEIQRPAHVREYVNYAMHRARMLKHFGVTPLLVFDGGLLPSKMGTEDAREAKRSDALARGRAFLAEGKGAQARDCFVKAVDVTPAMAFQLIKALRREGIQYVVAPYEADPQLAYLEKAGLVDAIVTEDSDLLVFGCRNVLFKLDGEGNCVSIARRDLARCREYNFTGWSDAEFRHMAILSGCDYLESVVGLGLKTAYRLLRKYKTPEKVIQFLRLEGQLTVPRTYLDEFRRAEHTFLHQHVFDPVTRTLTHLTPLPEGTTINELPFIGPLLDEDFARGIADGSIDPITKLAMVDLVPDSSPSTSGPFKPAPYRRTPAASGAASSGKPAAGSLLSYFSRAPAASTSAAAAANPARGAKAGARVVLVGGAKGAEKEEKEEPKRTSRFFGDPAVANKVDVKGKGKAVDDDEEEAAAADDSGFVDCAELPRPSSDVDAEEALRGMELSVELPSVVAVEDEAVVDALGADIALNADDPHRVHTRSPSLPAFVSSPVATPPRKRAKLSHSPLAAVSAAAPASDAGISSPAASTAAQAGWDADADEGALSSPVPAAAAVVKLEAAPTARPSAPVKRESQGDAIAALPPIELSSDPIVLSSDAPTPRPPKREAKPPRKPKAPARSASGKVKASPRRAKDVGVDVCADADAGADVGAISSGAEKGKKRAKARVREEEDEDEGLDDAVKAVAASWRAKFMMPAANKTPLGRTALGRPLPIPTTPQTTTRLPSYEMKAKPSTSSQKKGIASSSAVKASARPPLSPHSNRVAKAAPPPRSTSPLKLERGTSSQEHETLSPPTKKRRSVARDPLLLPLPSSDSAAAAQTASISSPVAVTNSRLLAFRFTGSVRRS